MRYYFNMCQQSKASLPPALQPEQPLSAANSAAISLTTVINKLAQHRRLRALALAQGKLDSVPAP